LGGIAEFTYLIALLNTVMSLIVIYLFNYSNRSLYKWIDIIKVLKGLQTMDTIGIHEKKYMEMFIVKIRIIKTIMKTTIYSASIFLSITCITILIVFFDSFSNIYFAILNAIFFCLWAYSALSYTLISFLYFFIVCYYCKMKFKLLNNMIEKRRMFAGIKLVNDVVFEHNSICNEVLFYNKFWKKYLFIMIYALTPINLMLIQLIFFEDLQIAALIAAMATVTGLLFTLLMFNLITASINREASKSYKHLLKLNISVFYFQDSKTKIRVLSISTFFLISI
jgi:hypothetical protein